MHIHLIEPDSANQVSLQRLLERLGHWVTDSPEQADVCLVSDRRILDIRMLPTPAIVVSDEGTVTAAAAAFEQGAVDFLRYPVLSSLEKALASLLDMHPWPTAAHSAPLPSPGSSLGRLRYGRMEALPGINFLRDGSLEQIFNVQKPPNWERKPCCVQISALTVQFINVLVMSASSNHESMKLLESSAFWEAFCAEVLVSQLWEKQCLPKMPLLVVEDITPELRRWIEAVARRSVKVRMQQVHSPMQQVHPPEGEHKVADHFLVT